MAKKQQSQVGSNLTVDARRQAIITLMHQAGPRCGLSARSAFQRWLRLIESDICCPIEGCSRLTPDRECDALHTCRQVRKQAWDLRVDGLKQAMPLFVEALAHLYLHYRENFEDLLGPIFETMGLGGKDGIFFTPWDLAQLMTNMITTDLRDVEEKECITVYDPACGSGVMLLAFLAHVSTKRPDLYHKVRPYGQDINEDCVRMCRISLRLVSFARAERLVAAYEAGDLGVALELHAHANPPPEKGTDRHGDQ